VIYELEPLMVRTLDSLYNLYLPGSTVGKQAPLSAIATFEQRSAPLRLDRLGQFPPPPSPSTWRPAARLARRSTPSRRRSARSACRARS